MRVPFIDLKRSIAPVREQILEDWTRCLDQTEFVGGPGVQRLEKELRTALQVEHAVTCANGTDALTIGLQALGVTAGMRVALPNMTFWAPFEAIVQLGAVPVLVDIDSEDLQMDFEEFKLGHEKYKFDAAILVHLFGWTSAALLEFRNYCQQQGIRLLEDGAQSYGVLFQGESVYRQAAVSTISFYPAKVLGAAGDAGAIFTPDPKRAEHIRALGNHGRAGHYTYDYVGWNSRMGGIQAHFLLRMLENMEAVIASRRYAEAFYLDYFSGLPQHVKVFAPPSGVTGNGYLSVIQSRTLAGDELAARLRDAGIGNARTYPQTLCQQGPAQKSLRTSSLAKSIEFSRMVINLPLFAGITPAECEASAQALRKALEAL